MTEQEREEKFRDWCAMWVDREDRGITELFTQEAEYIESWGPAYCGAAEIAHWFREWNTRGRVAEWTVGEFFHKGDQSAARWRFRCEMADGTVQRFEGMSFCGGPRRGRSPSSRSSAATWSGTTPMPQGLNRYSGRKKPSGFEKTEEAENISAFFASESMRGSCGATSETEEAMK